MRDDTLATQLLDRETLARLNEVADVTPGVMNNAQDPRWDADLAECEILLTGWGGPQLNAELLARAPKLAAVAHAAGTVKRIVTDESWQRGVRVSSAADANGVPVAEYSLAMILLAGKRVFTSQDFMRTEKSLHWAPEGSFGNHRATIGLVGASRIGRRVLDLLRPFDFEVLLADPTLTAEEARSLGAELVSLDELMSRSSVVSVHAPLLESTIGMIGEAELALMPDHATLINTARGAIVNTDALVTELRAGRIRAVLDVTDPEPLPADHELYSLPGVVLTPHVAGALGNELTRLGSHAVTEIERFVREGNFATEVRGDQVAEIA